MSEPEKNLGVEDKMLSLIDVSFEDDCLYASPSRDLQIFSFSDNQTEDKTVQFLDLQAHDGSLAGAEQVSQPLESAEQDEKRKIDKYNLRKSLAWDSAFFTSAGVLEPEELSCMIDGTKKGEKSILPGIEEDIYRSTDSISTLATDNSMLGTLADDFFGDIRASIQKLNKTSNVAISLGKPVSGVNEDQLIKSSEKMDIVAQTKIKTKASLKKPNVLIKGLGKMAKQVSPKLEVDILYSTGELSGSMNGESASSLRKPPEIVGRVNPILTTATKKASLGPNHVKLEKDSATNSTSHSDNPKKLTANRRTRLPISGSGNIVPHLTLPSKSSLRSSVVSKTELTTSSSVDSLGSLSSDSSSKHSLNTFERKNHSKTSNHYSSGATRNASKNMNESVSSRISPYLKSVVKLSSSISPTSSISEWSSASLSPTSTLNKRSNSSRPSLDTISSKDASGNGDAPQGSDSQRHSSEKCSFGHGIKATRLPSECVKRVSTASGAVICPDLIKPSGLRMPSPKIGFFDGVKSTVRTPTRSMQSRPAIPNGLPRYGPRNVSPSGKSNEAKLGKIQPARTAIASQGTRTGAQQPTSKINTKSPSPLPEPSNAALKVSTASRNKKYSPGMPLKVQNRMSSGNCGQTNLKAEKIAPKESNTAAKNPDSGYVGRHDSLCKHKMSPKSEGCGPVKDANNTSIKVGSPHNSSIICEAENKISSKEVGENAMFGQKNKSDFLSNINKKEKIGLEDQVHDLAAQVGDADIHGEIQQKPIPDSSLYQTNERSEVNTSVQENLGKLSMPAPTLTHPYRY